MQATPSNASSSTTDTPLPPVPGCRRPIAIGYGEYSGQAAHRALAHTSGEH